MTLLMMTMMEMMMMMMMMTMMMLSANSYVRGFWVQVEYEEAGKEGEEAVKKVGHHPSTLLNRFGMEGAVGEWPGWGSWGMPGVARWRFLSGWCGLQTKTEQEKYMDWELANETKPIWVRRKGRGKVLRSFEWVEVVQEEGLCGQYHHCAPNMTCTQYMTRCNRI